MRRHFPLIFPLFLLNSFLSRSLQVGGKWQWDAVALLRETLLNRSVDVQVMVELHLNIYMH